MHAKKSDNASTHFYASKTFAGKAYRKASEIVDVTSCKTNMRSEVYSTYPRNIRNRLPEDKASKPEDQNTQNVKLALYMITISEASSELEQDRSDP